MKNDFDFEGLGLLITNQVSTVWLTPRLRQQLLCRLLGCKPQY
jgi:hypothetical protein